MSEWRAVGKTKEETAVPESKEERVYRPVSAFKCSVT
jgi:hypothetical protein